MGSAGAHHSMIKEESKGNLGVKSIILPTVGSLVAAEVPSLYVYRLCWADCHQITALQVVQRIPVSTFREVRVTRQLRQSVASSLAHCCETLL